MIGGNANVRCTLLDHGQDGDQHAAHRADFLAVCISSGRHSEKMPEQLIRPVNQVNIHGAPISFLQAMLNDPPAIGGILLEASGPDQTPADSFNMHIRDFELYDVDPLRHSTGPL